MRNLFDPHASNVFLKPGEVFVAKRPALVSTVLGSCVSVVLHVPRTGMGAICHAMLPSGAKDDDFRYVDKAVSYLYDRLTSMCGGPSGIEAKLFGGADMLNSGVRNEDVSSVGRQNVEAALQVLDTLGLKVSAADTRGSQGRKLFFYSQSGEVFVRQVRKSF
ncbi:chemotaxis protein CheD [Geobacter sp. AOG2]|uniref:chemotaxis protein CheD n=1 Tax=Geobacter sp. AOG2 TaxID=1566347 RepID=UPI001CC58D37|nr:chemotaxis protein CheD [Geobacter sp. AOG2]GFE61512.1 putative chemoreceptor glutamine deamidase CheD2 [Geobacter sp. AOG2]